MSYFKLAILLVGTWMLLSSSAYSETRSFRDALDGRSMEDVISGPVDRDTSSYGDRTSGTGAANGSGGNGAPMMYNIPANGNLMPSQQMQQSQNGDEQQKSGSELEREAAPIGGSPMDEHQQQPEMAEQKSSRQRNRATGRLNSNGAPRSARLQQTPETNYGTSGTKATSEAGFGEEAAGGNGQGKGAQNGANQQSSYGQQKPVKSSSPTSGYGPTAATDEEQQQQQQPASVDQQQVMTGNGSDQQDKEKSYGSADSDGQQQVAAKQRAMIAMLMSMKNGLNSARYSLSRQPQQQPQTSESSGPQYGDKKPSYMAQNMIRSLANKAAYIGNQQQSQRQMAPPIMMPSEYGNANNQANYGQLMNSMLTSPPAAMAAMNSNGMRGMRRANQRKLDRKMSPAMVNAMLNKMLSMKQEGASNYDRESQFGMMMKSPQGAEILANMMMPQVNSAMNGMSPSKRDQYKRMMMAAIMQQLPKNDYSQSQEQSSIGGDSYDQQQIAGPTDKASMNSVMTTKADGYAATSQAMNGAKQNGYDNGEQQRIESGNSAGSDGYQPQMRTLMTNLKSAMSNRYDNQQQRETNYGDQPVGLMNGKGMSNKMSSNGYGAEAGSNGISMMNGPKMARQMNGRQYGVGEDAHQKRQNNGYDMNSMDQQQMQMANGSPDNSYSQVATDTMNGMKNSKQSMNGFRQTYSQPDRSQNVPLSQNYPSNSFGAKNQVDFSSTTSMPSLTGVYEQSQQQNGDQSMQQQDEYGATPMGQAEPFAFDYKVEDDYGNGHYRKEESDKNGVVRGSYGYTDVSGIYRHVEYIADENGFRANIKSNEPGLSSEPADTSSVSGNGPNSQSSVSQMPDASSMGSTQQQVSSENQTQMNESADTKDGGH